MIAQEIIKSLKAAIWFMFLTFPIMVIKVNTVYKTIEWRWMNMVFIGVGVFVGSFVWRWLLERKDKPSAKKESISTRTQAYLAENPISKRALQGALLVALLFFPMFMDAYQINIFTVALMYIVLGLGLNIVVGLAGLLDLGYVAFYAVGAYTYALLNTTFGMSFWIVLPIGGALAAIFGILLGFPVLRLRGDYLAIVTLGFGEIIRLVLENWNDFSHGPSGIAGIDKPNFFGLELNLNQMTDGVYYMMVVFTIITIFFVGRLQNSRIGRAWLALREDEIACQAMGIGRTRTKLMAFALGATWAGLMGVVFAAKTSFINPASFTFLESAIILSIVVLGGMGSIPGVILGALIMILLPEYMRTFSEYRMLVFGGAMVVMMVFRPQGLVSNFRRKYSFHGVDERLGG
ncbi:branched-chain amino acid ABC transporter permease [Seleniivibrio sp.]|uniref:ABC transporter permease subunit n=1 Tax=Seleniivibrio sp. TaxID=2898801 RepID=UPI0025E00E40|nr:branched-chain amino acid ABC transporter permease [Seleniivibrio sp.]MCD8552791.1 branched-chain amino acid ABC transporter permease [Seleniivibrio sp.]